MSKYKAVTFDGWSDHWFHFTQNSALINNWWNLETIKLLGPKIFEARLIPLNKVWPDIPNPE